MSVWVSVTAVAALVFVAVRRMLERGGRPPRRDHDWGDWPPDQMAP